MEAARERPSAIRIEAIDVFGNEYDGPADQMPVGQSISFCGPDPLAYRSFYGSIKRSANGTVEVR